MIRKKHRAPAATYRKVLQLDFVSTHKLTGKKVDCKVYVGSEGTRRGVPVQICYQPNWWFEVILNLLPEKPARYDSAVACAKN